LECVKKRRQKGKNAGQNREQQRRATKGQVGALVLKQRHVAATAHLAHVAVDRADALREVARLREELPRVVGVYSSLTSCTRISPLLWQREIESLKSKSPTLSVVLAEGSSSPGEAAEGGAILSTSHVRSPFKLFFGRIYHALNN